MAQAASQEWLKEIFIGSAAQAAPECENGVAGEGEGLEMVPGVAWRGVGEGGGGVARRSLRT